MRTHLVLNCLCIHCQSAQQTGKEKEESGGLAGKEGVMVREQMNTEGVRDLLRAGGEWGCALMIFNWKKQKELARLGLVRE